MSTTLERCACEFELWVKPVRNRAARRSCGHTSSHHIQLTAKPCSTFRKRFIKNRIEVYKLRCQKLFRGTEAETKQRLRPFFCILHFAFCTWWGLTRRRKQGSKQRLRLNLPTHSALTPSITPVRDNPATRVTFSTTCVRFSAGRLST